MIICDSENAVSTCPLKLTICCLVCSPKCLYPCKKLICNKQKEEKVIYCDTDSIITNKEEKINDRKNS